MSDDLRQFFDAFEADSLARTRPAGVAAVQGTVRRRAATRAVVLAVAVVAAVLLLVLPISGPPAPAPVHPPPSGSPSPSGTAGPASSPPVPSTSPVASAAVTRPANPACSPTQLSYVGLLLGSSAPDEFELTPGMLTVCPDLHLRLTRATYVGPGARATTLKRTSSTTTTLSPAHRAATLPAVLPAPSCASVLIVTYAGPLPAPATLPNMVPQLVATGSLDGLNRYLNPRGAFLASVSWQPPAC